MLVLSFRVIFFEFCFHITFCNPYKPEEMANAMLEIGQYSEELKRKGFKNIKRFAFKKSAQQIYNIILDSFILFYFSIILVSNKKPVIISLPLKSRQ